MRTGPLAAINSVALAIGRFATLDEMLEHALMKVLEVVQTDAGGIYLLDEENGELHLVVHRGMSEAVWRDFDRLKLGEGLSGRVALQGEPIVVRNLADDPRLTRMAARQVGFRAFASVPLRSNFRTYGTLNVHARTDREFSEEEVQLLTSMGSQIGLAVANAQLYLRLQASERKFRGLVEDAEDVIYLTDALGRVTYASPALERLLQWTPDDVSGREILEIVHPDDRPNVRAALERMLRGDVLRALEFRLLRRGGSGFRWFSQTNGPLRDEAGALLGLHCIAHDITDRRELQEQMLKAERLAHLGRMAANIAHEIRNPLGAIVNSIKLLRRAGAASDPRLLDIVTEEADRLDQIIREFLLFARPPARAPVVCDAGELLDSTVELFRRDAKLPDVIAVRLSCQPRLPAIYADPNQVRQVLWNLLTNAVESMAGPGAIDIEVRLDASGETLAVAVTDDGPGVADPEAVFEPFYTTKPQGTGLGLPIVARIIRDHGGALSVENVAGRGGRFTFTLPLASEAVAS
jgi:two-component system, sporulation sensor kinase E